MVNLALLSKLSLSSSVVNNYQTYNQESTASNWEIGMTGQRTTSVKFTEEESEYLLTQKLARVATVSPSEQPHVVPVVYEFDGQFIYFSGWNITKSLKFRNLQMNNKVAMVIDDVAPSSRWSPRGIEIRGTAEPIHCDGGTCIRVVPLMKSSWGL